MRVLLVDDSPEVRAAFARLLQTDPAVEVVGGAAGGDAALGLIASQEPDLVVLDVELACGERGLDVLQRIRARHPRVQVIMLSNYGWSALRSPFLQAGARAYFDKANQFRDAADWIHAHAVA